MASILTGWTVDAASLSALAQAANLGIRPTGANSETVSRLDGAFTAQTIVAGQPVYTAIYLLAGQVVSNITFWSSSTAAATPTHLLFGLADATGKIVATSADALTAAWAANSAKTLPMTVAYTVPTEGLYYVVIAESATTLATITGLSTTAALALQAPAVAFTDTANATTTAFIAGAATKSAGFSPLYAYTS